MGKTARSISLEVPMGGQQPACPTYANDEEKEITQVDKPVL